VLFETAGFQIHEYEVDDQPPEVENEELLEEIFNENQGLNNAEKEFLVTIDAVRSLKRLQDWCKSSVYAPRSAH